MTKHTSDKCIIICVDAMTSLAAPGKTIAELIQAVTGELGIPDTAALGDLFYHYAWRPSIMDDISKAKRVRAIQELRSIGEQERLESICGDVWVARRDGKTGRPRAVPIEFQYRSAQPDRADVGHHAMLMLSISADLLGTLPWEKLTVLLRGMVETIERGTSGIVSLFVEFASKGKHDRGHSYGFTINAAEDIQFRLEQQLWHSAARDGQLKLRGVHWGNYLSPQHLAVIPDAASLPARLARWDGDPQGPRIDCKCWPTPGGGLWIELFEVPCHWPNAQPRTQDHNAVRTAYNEFYRAGFFNWRAAQVRR